MRPGLRASHSMRCASDWSTMPLADSSITWARQPNEGDAVKFRRRSSVLPRTRWPNGIERTEPLRGQLWTRSEQALREPGVSWGWRALAIAVAALEAALLVWRWFGPALAISSVQVTGAHHLTSSQVARDAGLSGDTSVISVDVVTAHDRLMKQVGVRSVDVQPQLLGTVVIQVSECEPVGRPGGDLDGCGTGRCPGPGGERAARGRPAVGSAASHRARQHPARDANPRRPGRRGIHLRLVRQPDDDREERLEGLLWPRF